MHKAANASITGIPSTQAERATSVTESVAENEADVGSDNTISYAVIPSQAVVTPLFITYKDIVAVRNEARQADAEALSAEANVERARTPEQKAAARQTAQVKFDEADVKHAQATIREAESELHSANVELSTITTPEGKLRAETRKAVAESRLAEGEVIKAAAEARLADAEVRQAKTPEAKRAAEEKKAAKEARLTEAGVKKSEVDARKAEVEVKQVQAQAKASNTPQARAAVEAKKAEAETKKAEVEVRRAQAEVKSAKAPAEKAKVEEKVAVAELKKAEAEVKKAEVEARHADDKAKESGAALDQQMASAKQSEAEVKKAEIEVRQAQGEARTANTPESKKQAEEKLAQAEVKKAEREADKAEREVKLAETLAAASGATEGQVEVAVRQAEAEVKKAEAEVKQAAAEVKTATTPLAKESAEVRQLDAEVKKADAELKNAEREAQRDSDAARAPQSGYLKAAVNKKAEASAARLEAKKVELEVKKIMAEVKQAELEVRQATTPQARAAAEKRFESKLAEARLQENKAAALRADADTKEADFALVKRSSDSKITAIFGGMALSTMTQGRLQEAMTVRQQFMASTLKPALSILQADPQAADLKTCTDDSNSGKTCIRPGNPAVARLEALISPRIKLPSMVPTVSFLPAIQRKVAVVIGNNAYQDPDLPPLDGAVKDADAVAVLLKQKMGYDVRLLLNATKADIVSTLNQVSDETGSNDSVLVYYAGHGYQMPRTRLGYWMPTDATIKDPGNWLSNTDINKILTNIPAWQMIVMSDSCYSGTLANEQKLTIDTVGKEASQILTRRSVLVMSSGGEEPVTDEGREGHSVFAWHLMDRLNNVEKYTNGLEVLDAVKAEVAREGIPQTPQYGVSISAGHKPGGEYLFEVRKH